MRDLACGHRRARRHLPGDGRDRPRPLVLHPVPVHDPPATLVVEALPTGTRLRSQIELQVHPHEAASAHRRFTEGAERHLASVVRQLEAMPDGASLPL